MTTWETLFDHAADAAGDVDVETIREELAALRADSDGDDDD